MPRQSSSCCSRLTALGCVVLVAGLLLPPEVFAQTTPPHTPLLNSARTAARQAGAMKERRTAQSAQSPQTPSTDLRSGSFFKSPAGIVTIVVFGAGVGYAVYSSSNDRIRSAGR